MNAVHKMIIPADTTNVILHRARKKPGGGQCPNPKHRNGPIDDEYYCTVRVQSGQCPIKYKRYFCTSNVSESRVPAVERVERVESKQLTHSCGTWCTGTQ